MREIRTSGSMSGSGKPGGDATAPRLDSTETEFGYFAALSKFTVGACSEPAGAW